MIFKLETPEHQRTAIQSVVEVFRGMEKNTYDNATDEDIRANYCSLSLEALMANINKIASENGIDPLQAYFQESRNACIEMETGTGKTLTYLQSAYELYKEYGLTKFIVLVPSIPIRQGAIDTFENFKTQLEDKYDFTPNTFVYDSSKLSDLRDFITAETPQIMIMTMASFNSEDYDPNYFDIDEANVCLRKLSATAISIPITKNKTQKHDTPLSINPNADISECLHDLLEKLKNMSESERKAFINDMLPGVSGDDEDDDDDYELEDIHGIYDVSEKAKRYTVRVELVDAPEKVTRTLQLPSNMVLSGFAQLIMLAFGRQDVPEPYEFVEEDGFRFVSDDEEFALDKDYWKMDDVEFNTVGFLLQKKGETVSFNIRKGKKKVIWRHTIVLEKSGRYTEKSEHRIELLKGEGFYPSKSMKSMDDYVKHFQQDKPKKPNFDGIRQRIRDFEKDNELLF